MRLERNFKQNFIVIRRTVDNGLTKRSETKCSKQLCTKGCPRLRYLTTIPRARMGSESIAHEAEGRMGY